MQNGTAAWKYHLPGLSVVTTSSPCNLAAPARARTARRNPHGDELTRVRDSFTGHSQSLEPAHIPISRRSAEDTAVDPRRRAAAGSEREQTPCGGRGPRRKRLHRQDSRGWHEDQQRTAQNAGTWGRDGTALRRRRGDGGGTYTRAETQHTAFFSLAVLLS